MKKFKRMVLGFGSLATALTPVAAVIACGTESNVDNTKILTLHVAEDGHLALFKKIIKKFKTDNAKFIKDNNIDEIKIIKASPGLKDLQNKGIRDEDAFSDIFTFPENELPKFLENDALKEFSSTTLEAFAIKYMGENRFLTSVPSGISNSKLYGIPQNVESMVALGVKTTASEASKKQITEYANLWTAAGFFNTARETTSATQVNLRDIVKTDENGNVVWGDIGDANAEESAKKAEWKKVLKAGFLKILNSIIEVKSATSSSLNQTIFDNDAEKAQPKIFDFIADNTDKVKFLRGAWASKRVLETAKKKAKANNVADAEIAKMKIVASAPSNWKPWASGWLYAMNGRISSGEHKVAEKLIAYFHKKEYAKEFYESVGKLSPTTKGKETLESDQVHGAAGSVAKAIYQAFANSLPNPIETAFNDLWSKYAVTVNKHKQQLVAVSASTKSSLAETLTTDFITEIESLMKKK